MAKRKRNAGVLKVANTEDAIIKVLIFCNDFAEKLQYGYECTLFGYIDLLIRNWSINGIPASKIKKRKILAKIIKLSCEEIRKVSSVLREIHKILDKDCCDVISTVADEEILELSSLLPVWIGNINETAPQTVGAIPAKDDSIVKPGQYVAAFVSPPPSDNILYEEFGVVGSWILARVLSNENRKNKKQNNTLYRIVSLDIIDVSQAVDRKALIPLPLYRADPRTNPEAIFPAGAVVLAGNMKKNRNDTFFHPAIVLDTPKTLSDTYTVCFRDLSLKLHFGPTFQVQQRYVIKYVEPF